jgi:dynein heavy chain
MLVCDRVQACLPLIDDLSNTAMRTRHWKQLVRVTGGALTIDNDTLKRMTFGELLSLGLQRE